MQFNITVINVQATTKPTKKGSYIMLDVAYKNETTGKIEGKKIMSFTNKAVFDTLSSATNGNTFTITSEKNEESGYWDWTSVAAATDIPTASATPVAGKSFATPKSTYETAEERAARQALIVRQSSLTAAINTLGEEKTPARVMELAQTYTDWVFQKEDATNWDNVEDDVPV